ncbi:MAG: hypothetical protein ACK5RG_09875 [Cyclobacteriaceae bacterium]|nr:hypothetical protein [Flammeovirgaceae bacterium]
MKRLLVSISLMGIAAIACGQSVITQMGARQMAMAGASATLSDEWALYNNVAGLAQQKQSCGFAYETSPQLIGANRMAAHLQLPFRSFTTGIGFFRFGDALYNEQIISIGIANRIGITSLGAKVNFNQYRADGFGVLSAISIDIGGITQFTPALRVAAHISNITQSSLNNGSGERIPTRMVLGVGFQFTNKITATTEVEKDLHYPLTWRTGFEYDIYKKLFIRTGYQLQPNAFYFGLGGKRKRLSIDYALRYHFLLGASHQASATFQLTRSANP